jgi:hypothetical protein
VVELDESTLRNLGSAEEESLREQIAALGVVRPVTFAPYRTGSAFVQPAA